MGGLMDIFGYPFCYGRIFETIEKDTGQYDSTDEIFWASGTASIYRKDVYLAAGGLDDKFFAHQEEIDLDWRFLLMGYSVKAAPQSIVYHYSGATLPPGNLKKKYLNHRNSILMILKNYELKNIIWILPLRIILELMAAVLAVKQRDYRRVVAIFRGGLWNLFNFPHLFTARRNTKKIRKISDDEVFKHLYCGTIALEYYILKKKTIAKLNILNK
jgi:GT2 family glycosyltransferase